MNHFNLYPMYNGQKQNDYSSIFIDPVPVPRINMPPVSFALPYSDPSYGIQSYINGPPINLNPVNNYGMKRLEMKTPNMDIGITGRNDQLIKLMNKVNELINNKTRNLLSSISVYTPVCTTRSIYRQ